MNGANDVAFGYDNDGLLTSAGGMTVVRDPVNGLVTDTTLRGVTDHRTYDSFGQIATYEAKFGTTSLYSVHYVRDALGRIETKTETIQGTTTAWGYSYDSSGRLWQVMKDGILTATYLYDGNGNRLSKATPAGTEIATYDNQDRLLSYGRWTYTYTANGELWKKTDTTTGAVTTYGYDGVGNLRRVDLADGRVIEYVVDGLNRRVAKKVDGAVTRRWLYRGALTPIAELDGSGNLLSRFTASVVTMGGQRYRSVGDQLGSPRLLIKDDTGTVSQRLEHDEWGCMTAATGSGPPLGFARGLYDSDTGLTRFGTRDYDAETGRWQTKDLAGFRGSQANLYEYDHGDPVNLVDPDGRIAWVVVPGVAAAAIGLYLLIDDVISTYKASQSMLDFADASKRLRDAQQAAVDLLERDGVTEEEIDKVAAELEAARDAFPKKGLEAAKNACDVPGTSADFEGDAILETTKDLLKALSKLR